MKRLRILRESKGLKQSEVAEYINKSFQAYSLYELGKREPDNDTLLKLAELYNVSTDYLLGVDDKKNTPSVINRKVLDVYDKLSDEARLKLLSYCEDLLANPKNLK